MVELAAREAGNVHWNWPGGKGNIISAITTHSCPHIEDETALQAGKVTCPIVPGKQMDWSKTSSWCAEFLEEKDLRTWLQLIVSCSWRRNCHASWALSDICKTACDCYSLQDHNGKTEVTIVWGQGIQECASLRIWCSPQTSSWPPGLLPYC